MAGLSALRRGAGLGTASAFASTGSSGMQQAMMHQLANRRLLRQQIQQQLIAQQEMSQSQGSQLSGVTPSDQAQQAREQRLAQRQARAAAIAERRAAAKARNLVKSQIQTPTDGTQIVADQ
jgi:hypothetical protein